MRNKGADKVRKTISRTRPSPEDKGAEKSPGDRTKKRSKAKPGAKVAKKRAGKDKESGEFERAKAVYICARRVETTAKHPEAKDQRKIQRKGSTKSRSPHRQLHRQAR